MANLKEKFCQMILLGLDVPKINPEIEELIKTHKIGGVVLYKQNYKTIQEMIDFINQLKELNKSNIPLFIGIDQENGRVNRLPDDVKRIYNPLRQSKTKDVNIINECNDITSDILSMVGVNMNFSPVVDILYYEEAKGIGNRSYGNSSGTVIKYALPMINTYQNKNIIPVVKHFPGHGIVEADSHFSIPTINDIDKMKKDLKVYKEAIEMGCDAVLIGHLRVSGYGKYPASINEEIIDDFLVNKFNYNGLIITDDLRMNVMKYIYGLKKVITLAVESGNNVLMVKYKKNDTKKILNKIYDLIDKKVISSERLEISYQKILDIKTKYNITNKTLSNKIDISKINQRIENVNNKM